MVTQLKTLTFLNFFFPNLESIKYQSTTYIQKQHLKQFLATKSLIRWLNALYKHKIWNFQSSLHLNSTGIKDYNYP